MGIWKGELYMKKRLLLIVPNSDSVGQSLMSIADNWSVMHVFSNFLKQIQNMSIIKKVIAV